MSIVTALIVILITGLVGGLIAKRFGQPLLLGYILAGVVVSLCNNELEGWVLDYAQIQGLADIGVALLLFSMGLEFSPAEIRPIKNFAVWGALLQVFFTMLCMFVVGYFLGLNFYASGVAGAVFVSTSTAVVLKTLSSKNQSMTLCGRTMIGSSIVQDLTVIPIMMFFLNLSHMGEGIQSAFKPIVFCLIFLAVMFTLGAKFVSWILRRVAAWNTQELFLLCIVAISLGIGFIADKMGLSFSFGAFIAGIVLNGSDYGKKALYELVSVRDIFSLLFFVSIGMLLDISFLADHLYVVLILVFVTGFSRTIFLSLSAWVMGYRNVIPVAMFFGMFPTSEIAFIVLNVALAASVFTKEIYSLFLSTVICSMLIGPLMGALTNPVYDYLRRRFNPLVINTINTPETLLRDHVVIAGGGKVARVVARVLAHLKIPYVIIEPDHFIFLETRDMGFECIFGAPYEEVILKAANVSRAKILIAAATYDHNVHIIRNARMLNPEIAVVSRADSQREAESLREYKVFEVVRPIFEFGLELSRLALHKLEIPMVEAQNYLDSVRYEYCKPLNIDRHDAAKHSKLHSFIGMAQFRWVEIKKDSPFTGKTFADFKDAMTCGGAVIGLMHGEDFILSPTPDTVLNEGDIIAIVGKGSCDEPVIPIDTEQPVSNT